MTKRGRRGVSEVVATLALIAITLVAMAIYIEGYNRYYAGETGLLSGTFRIGSEQNYERVSILYVYQNTTALYVVVFNYGARNATIDKVIIDTNTQAYSPSLVTTDSLAILRVNTLLPVNDNAHVISVITDRNNVISTQFRL